MAAQFGGQERIGQKHHDSQRAHATGHGRDLAGYLADGLEVDIAHQPAIDAVDPHVNHRRPRLHHLRRNHSRTAHCCNEDVSLARDRGQFGRLAVADRDGGVATMTGGRGGGGGRSGRQQQRQWLAHDIATANNHRMAAGRLDLRVDQKPLHACGGAGHKPRPPLREEARVFRMESVHVEIRRHRIEHGQRVDMRRQRQLHEDSIDLALLAAGDSLHERHEFGRRGRGGSRHHLRLDAHTGGGGRLALHVRSARCHLTHQHHHQPRPAMKHRGEGLHLGAEAGFDPGGEAAAVEDRGSHQDSPPPVSTIIRS